MKIKYQYEITFSGFDPEGVVKRTGVVSNLYELHSAVSGYRFSSRFKNKTDKVFKDFFDKLADKHDVKSAFKLNEVIKKNKKVVKIKTKELKFDDSHDKTPLVWAFHTNLRKGCDSPASWGLWQNINYAAERKDPISSLGLEVFWANMAYVWRIVLKNKKYTPKKIKAMSNEEGIKLAKAFREKHMTEMKNDLRLEGKVLGDNHELRALWYMLLGLYSGMPDDEIYSCLYALADADVK